MNVDITKLQNNLTKIIEFNETLTYTEEYYKNTDIVNLSDIKVKGSIEKLTSDVYHLSMMIKGSMTLKCAVSQENVEYPINIAIDKNIEENSEFKEENYEINKNTLDILKIVWENIVLEIPLRIVKENATCKKEGEGWILLDENNKGENKRDNPFDELKRMLDMEGNK